MYVDVHVTKFFWTSYEILFDGLSAHSFRDLIKKRGYHGSFGWLSTLPSVSIKQSRTESESLTV